VRIAPSPRRPGFVGPDVLAGISHGSHICAFYETKDDLIDLVLPFFATGRERDELCVWVMPAYVPMDEARSRAREAAVELGIELYPAHDIYQKDGRFAHDQVMHFWDMIMQRPRVINRSGTRGSGDAFWLERNDWHTFLEYEAYLNTYIANKPLALLCTFPISLSNTGDLFDVVRAHHFAIAKRRNRWEVIAAPAVAPDTQVELADAAARVASLTRRERQVLEAIIDGRPNKVIANDLELNVRTIEAHRTRLMHRLGVRTMMEAVRLGTLARLVAQTPLSPTR
jgi:DNA-binding CsgD family transcriptional regulator